MIKKYSKIFAILAIMATTCAAAKAEDVKKKTNILPLCDEGKKIDLDLGKSRIKFSIPEKYFDPRDIYKKLQNPAELISVALNKTDMSQNCHEDFSDNKISYEFYHVTVHPSDPGLISKMIKSQLRVWFSKSSGIEANKFQVFSTDYTESKPWDRQDLLIPVIQKKSNNSFLHCYYSFPSAKIIVRTGCRVISDFGSNMYIEYGIKPDEVNSYEQIDEKIKSKISEFIDN